MQAKENDSPPTLVFWGESFFGKDAELLTLV